MKRFLTMLMGILMVIGGVSCLFTPVSTFLATGYVIGFIMLFDAIGNIFAWFNARKYQEISGWYLVGAIISGVFGLIIMTKPAVQAGLDIFIVYMISTWVIISGVYRIVMSLRIKKLKDALPQIFKNKKWVGVLITGILMIVIGIICLFKPIYMSSFLGTMIALVFIFSGANIITLGTFIFD